MPEYHYDKIADDIRGKIERQELKDGQRLPAERELARQWNVTPVTVSRAMKQLVDDGLVVRLRGRRGSFVSIQEQVVSKGRAGADLGFRRVGLVYSWYISHGYYSNGLLQGMQEEVDAAEALVFMPFSGFHNYSQLIDEENLDGLILLAPPENKRPEVETLLERRVPVAVVGGSWESQPNWPCVDSDGRAMGRMAAEHLVECGYEKIAAVVCSTQLSNNRLRLEAFLDSMAVAGVRIAPQHLLIEPEQTDYESQIRNLLSSDDRPDAVFAGSYLLAEMVAGVADRLGLKIPTDLALVGCDSAYDGRVLSRLPLTTVSQPLFEIGRAGMKLFKARLADPGGVVSTRLLGVNLVRGVTTMTNPSRRRKALEIKQKGAAAGN